MKKLLIGLTIFASVSSSASCFENISKREKTINIYSTIDYSRCNESELVGAKSHLLKFLTNRVTLLQRERLKRDSGQEQFRILTEINAGKVSLVMINSALRREGM